MKRNDKKKLAQVAVENVKAWMADKPPEEIETLITRKGKYANDESYVTLARIASGKCGGRPSHLSYAFDEIRQLLVDRIRELSFSPYKVALEYQTTKQRRSKVNAINARKPRRTRDIPSDLKDAIQHARELIRAGYTQQAACETAIEKYSLGIKWNALRSRIYKGKQK
jgi:hypothetical protein